MNNGKQDNWRRRLLELDSLPGETAYNKEAAWGLLQNRLQRPARRKKKYWYLAAAALLLLLGVPLLIKRTTAPYSKENIAARPVPHPVITTPPVEKLPAARVIATAPAAKKTVVQKVYAHAARPANSTDYATPQKLSAGNDTAVAAAVGAVYGPDSTTATLATAKPEPALQVVHINDLETPAAALLSATAPARSRWRTKRSQRLPVNQLAAAQTAGDGIIHIKLPFKN